MRSFVPQGLTVALLLATSVAVYQTFRAGSLKRELTRLRTERSTFVDQIDALQKQREADSSNLQAIAGENERLRKSVAELPRLRGEITSLRAGQDAQPSAAVPAAPALSANSQSPSLLKARARIDQIKVQLQQMPEKSIPEIELMDDTDWFAAIRDANFKSDAEIRLTLSKLRALAKKQAPFAQALHTFIEANGGNLPQTMSDLAPHFRKALGPTEVSDSTLSDIFSRYSLVATGRYADLPPDAWIIVENAPVDKEFDTRAKFGNGRSSIVSTGPNRGGDPDDPSY